MLERIEIMLEVCTVWLLGTITFSLSLLILSKAIHYIEIVGPKRKVRSYLKSLIRKLVNFTSKFTGKVFTNWPLSLLLIYTIAIVGWLIYIFNCYLTIDKWESLAVYLNNMLSPVILIVTIYYIRKSWIAQKLIHDNDRDITYDKLFIEQTNQKLTSITENLNSNDCKEIIEFLDTCEINKTDLRCTLENHLSLEAKKTNSYIYQWIFDNKEHIKSETFGFTPPDMYQFLDNFNMFKSASTKEYFVHTFVNNLQVHQSFLRLIRYDIEQNISIFNNIEGQDKTSTKKYKKYLETFELITSQDLLLNQKGSNPDESPQFDNINQ